MSTATTTTAGQAARGSLDLLSAIDAIRNLRALALMLGSMVGAALVMGLAGYLGAAVHPVFGFLLALAAAAVFFYGLNAVGILLMDQAKGRAGTTIPGALLQSLFTAHRLLVVFLLVLLLYLAGLLLLGLVLLVCKIPVLGPVLFTVVFPVSIVVTGVAAFALNAVVFPLAAPSVWDGSTTMQAVSRLAAIARSRLVKVLIMMALLFFIAGAVAAFVMLIVISGTMVTGGMAAPILGGGMAQGLGGLAGSFMGGYGGMGGMGMGGGYGGGAGSGYLVAAGIGGGVVYAIAFSLPLLVYVRGCCQVYLSTIDEVDVGSTEALLASNLQAVRNKGEELRARAAAGAAAAAAAARPPSDAPPAAATRPDASPDVPPASLPDAPMALRCPDCRAPYPPGDKFCGICGARLS